MLGSITQREPEANYGFQVIVISHTDVTKDNRILKQIDAVLKVDDVDVLAIGITSHESVIPRAGSPKAGATVSNVDLDKFLRFVGRFVRLPPRKGKLLLLNQARALRRTMILLVANLAVLYRALKKASIARSRVIICNDDQLLLAASILKTVTKSRLIYDSHELNHDRNGQTKIEKAFSLRWQSFFWNQVDFFITVSEPIRLHYLEVFGPKPSAVVLNSPSLSGKSSEDDSLGDVRGVLGLDFDQTILIYVGAFAEGRGIRPLLALAEQLPPKLHLVFLGEGLLLPEIVKCSESFERIHHLPPVPHENIVGFISTANIGLCLLEPVSMSDRLALPNKFFDYAFAGLPILYSGFPAMARLAEEFGLGLESEHSLASLLDGVSLLNGRRTSLDSLEALSWEEQEKILVEAVSFLGASS